jgi:hypothetical protein
MEDSQLTLRKKKFDLNQFSINSFKDSINEIILKGRKNQIQDFIMKKRLSKKISKNNIYNEVDLNDNEKNKNISKINFEELKNEKDIIKRIKYFYEYIAYILCEKINLNFFEENYDFIIQSLSIDFPKILFEAKQNYSDETITQILYIYILFLNQESISENFIKVFLNNSFLSELNLFFQKIYLQKELSLIIITLCNFLIANLLQYDKYSYTIIINSINIEFIINVTINRILSFEKNDLDINKNPIEKMFIVLILLIRNYLLYMNNTENEKYYNICQKILYILKTLIKKFPNENYMISETIHLFRICKVNDYINDNEINLIFQNIIKNSSENFNEENFKILFATLLTINKELKLYNYNNEEYENLTNDSDDNEIEFEINNHKTNFLNYEEILFSISKIIYHYFIDFSKSKDKFKNNIDILIYSIRILTKIFNFPFNDLKDKIKNIIIQNESNISLIEILKMCYSISIEQIKIISLTKTILNFFHKIFLNNNNDIIKKYLISNQIKLHEFLGRTLEKTKKEDIITYYILKIIQNILYFSNKISQLNNIKFDLISINFTEFISNLQLNSCYKEIRSISYEILREYFDKEIINDDYLEYYISEDY